MSLTMVLVIVFLLLVIAILFLKVRLIVDTEQDRYEVRLVPLGKARIIELEGQLGYKWELLFFHKKGQFFSLEDEGKRAKKKKKKREKSENEKLKNGAMSLRKKLELGRSILPSFKINHFHLLLNTNDPIFNAWLYPAFTLWRAKGHDVELRFFGSSKFILDIENAVHRVIGALLYNYLIKPLRS